MGSKNRLAKCLVPIIQSYITEDTRGYLEPFVGGANMIDKIQCNNKIGCDIHKPLIALLNKAKDDSELLLANGDKQRAGYVKDQYLEEKFLPAIETIANMHSVDELLNSKKALDMFDEYASLDNKSGTGYTASFLKTLHKEDRGSFSGTSDSVVRDGIKEMMLAANNDKIRSAIDIAKKLKSKIDSGDNIASQEDYELIQKVVLRA